MKLNYPENLNIPHTGVDVEPIIVVDAPSANGMLAPNLLPQYLELSCPPPPP